MYLTELAEKLEEAINTSSPENWGGGVVVPVDMPVLAGFDPFSESESLDPGIYIVPGYNEYDFANARKTVGISVVKRITVVICTPFQALLDIQQSRGDVSLRSEWALLSNLREDLEGYLIRSTIPNVKLVEIEPEPVDELALDNRLFLAATILGYRAC